MPVSEINLVIKVSLVVWVDQIQVFSHLFDAFDVFLWLPLWMSTPVQRTLSLTVVKNPPANAVDTRSNPGPGRSHMLRSN